MEHEVTEQFSPEKAAFKHLQARLGRQDALRFKHAVERHGMTLQQGLIHAINLALNAWGEDAVEDPGPRRREQQ